MSMGLLGYRYRYRLTWKMLRIIEMITVLYLFRKFIYIIIFIYFHSTSQNISVLSTTEMYIYTLSHYYLDYYITKIQKMRTIFVFLVFPCSSAPIQAIPSSPPPEHEKCKENPHFSCSCAYPFT